MLGSHNDLNVLDRSYLFSELAEGRSPLANYTINDHQYTMGYYLADGIHPKWATLVQTISQPQGLKRQLFATMQEACQKDVKRAFGVLQAHERDDFLDDEYDGMEVRPPVQVLREPTLPFTEFIARHHMIRSSAVHHTLHNDLIEHFLSREGEQG
ncbi:hypothetical protein HHK36_018295 [Tetracentron sinense]|uniref:Uncharacterized protein n=1 Tax=Tetracentron sinense TaxID=13715 RepID=A0A834YZB8_TETSI|nr:hypothetical protein HHK36_018295 [Tetracentron sinense]